MRKTTLLITLFAMLVSRSIALCEVTLSLYAQQQVCSDSILFYGWQTNESDEDYTLVCNYTLSSGEFFLHTITLEQNILIHYLEASQDIVDA